MGLSTKRFSDSFEHAGAHYSPAGKTRWRKSMVLLGATVLCCASFVSFSVGAAWGTTVRSLNGDRVNTGRNSALPSPLRSGRRIFTVFSTSCSPYQDWQSQALLYSHKRCKIEGELVRLMACGNSNYTLPKHSHDHYRVIRTPDFNARIWCDDYSPRNRPQGMSYWLNGRSDDTDLPHDDDVIIQVDADQIFLSSNTDVVSTTVAVRNGSGIAAAYELGQSWIQEWAIPFCDGKCDVLENGYDGSYGAPYVLTAGDARRHADLWSEVTEEMRQHVGDNWMMDMYAAIIAARRLGIQMNVIRMMLSDLDDYQSEPWEKVGWHDSPAGPGVWVAHYCQRYKIGKFKWYKYDNTDTDIRLCNRSATNFPSPDEADVVEMQRAREGTLDYKNGTREAVMNARNVWMLDHTLEPVKQAIDAYFDEFC